MSIDNDKFQYVEQIDIKSPVAKVITIWYNDCTRSLYEIGQPSLSYKRRKRAIKDILRKPKTR